MIYKAVGNLCAVDFNELKLPVPFEEAVSILESHGFRFRSKFCTGTEVSTNAKRILHTVRPKYKRGAALEDAPFIFDCSSFTKWLYAQYGVWLPRHSIDQREFIGHIVNPSQIRGGDLVFTTGYRNYYWDDPADGVGHVGISTDEGTVIHAANSRSGVVESPLEAFVKEKRGIKRVFPREVSVIVSPADRIVEWSQQFRWIILQYLK